MHGAGAEDYCASHESGQSPQIDIDLSLTLSPSLSFSPPFETPTTSLFSPAATPSYDYFLGPLARAGEGEGHVCFFGSACIFYPAENADSVLPSLHTYKRERESSES